MEEKEEEKAEKVLVSNSAGEQSIFFCCGG
jgi:hypothetical protein